MRSLTLTMLLALLWALAPLTASAQSVAAQVDAAGDGSLRPPTSPRYANPAWYDIIDVRLLEGDPIRIAVELGAVDASPDLPLGITQPIIEVYADVDEGGAEELLPGSGLSMPLGDGWQLAFRITGDGAWAWQASDEGAVDLTATVHVEVVVEDRVLTLLTPFERSESEVRLYAISGVYDPFRAGGWRPLSREPSPWAFSSATQLVPVVDVFPSDPVTRAESLARGELPRAPSGVGFDLGTLAWAALMLAGLAIAIAGVVVRVRARRTPEAPHTPAATPEEEPASEPLSQPSPDAAEPVWEPELIDDAELLDYEEEETAEASVGEVAPDEAALESGDEVEPDGVAPGEDEPEDEDASSDTSAPSEDKREANRS